mmetsp:Transcript_26103/g.40001  ORF Transcript_26103/g.40001 Transcript_26103/m.40001 type:complete len:338 (+) Transcript_26103:111-1124(+)
MEGGWFPWKVQKIKAVGPTVDYSNLQNPLPNPPKGMTWEKDEKTQEWRVVNEEEKKGYEQKIVRKGPLSKESDNKSTQKQNKQENKDSIVAKETTTTTTNQQKASSYFEHVVLPTDTLQGLCLQYKVSATKLRQMNRFSGSNLLLAPDKLMVPVSEDAIKQGQVRKQDRTSKTFKTQAFIAELRSMSAFEAKAYLELANWDLPEAIRQGREDLNWEKKEGSVVREQQQALEKEEEKAAEAAAEVAASVQDVRITLNVHEPFTNKKKLPVSLFNFGTVKENNNHHKGVEEEKKIIRQNKDIAIFPPNPSGFPSNLTECLLLKPDGNDASTFEMKPLLD